MDNRSQMQRYQDACFERALAEVRNMNPQTDTALDEILDRIRAEIVLSRIYRAGATR
jgi:hypothetical protein